MWNVFTSRHGAKESCRLDDAYQYRKAFYHGDVDCAERIKAAKHARLAKLKSKQIGETRSGWNDVRVHWMRHLLLAKFKTSKEVRAAFLATGNAELVEFVASKEGFWGLGRGYKNGRNTLGKLLCDVRDNDIRPNNCAITYLYTVALLNCKMNVFMPHSWNVCWVGFFLRTKKKSLHMECVYATFSSNCAKDHESCGMCLRHVTALKNMSHVECVYATFSSSCANISRVMWNVFTSRHGAKDHESCRLDDLEVIIMTYLPVTTIPLAVNGDITYI